MVDPLRSTSKKNLRSLALEYLALLGYDVNENPESYLNDLQLGHRTYQSGLDIFTVYYYNTTYGEEMDLHEIEGKNVPEVKKMLERLFQFGWFFDQITQNITRGYPEFVPSTSPLKRGIPRDPEKLIEILRNILRGFDRQSE